MEKDTNKGYTKGKFIKVLCLLVGSAVYFTWKDYRDEGELSATAIWSSGIMLAIGVIVLLARCAAHKLEEEITAMNRLLRY